MCLIPRCCHSTLIKIHGHGTSAAETNFAASRSAWCMRLNVDLSVLCPGFVIGLSLNQSLCKLLAFAIAKSWPWNETPAMFITSSMSPNLRTNDDKQGRWRVSPLHQAHVGAELSRFYHRVFHDQWSVPSWLDMSPNERGALPIISFVFCTPRLVLLLQASFKEYTGVRRSKYSYRV